ncbi:MAG: carbohydrate-binding protein [Rhizobiaceae bacterium]|nr:carbohydrate-binding protein [Rhizobiaceae bacterium]
MTSPAFRPGGPSFSEPGPAFRMAAYWFWSSLPTDDEIERQLSDFRDKGYGTILIQARLGMPRALYLSEPFLERYRKAVEVMRRLGLAAGLYDDYNWTSGQAGGRTVQGAPHLSERHLFWATVDRPSGVIDGIEAPFATGMGADIAEWIYEGGRPVFGAWDLVAAVVHPEGCTDPSMPRDVTDQLRLTPREEGCEFTLSGELPAGHRLTVFAAARCLTSRLINYLMPEAGARFVAVGLEPYAEALGDLMGTTLDFLFFDQPAPQFYRWRQHRGNLGNAPLHAPALGPAVEAASGASFATVLLALVHDIGPATARLRLAYYRTYARLMNEAFFMPLRDFCRQHGLRLTGHEILPHIGGYALNGGFSSIDPRIAPAVDFFGIDAMRDETAVDVNNFGPQLSPKLGDSVARAHGRSRTMAEIYATATRTTWRGAGQWELTPATFRAQAIRLHLAGMRQLVMHALYHKDGRAGDMRLFVNPRFDFAPGLNFEPWWNHHLDIADETARLSIFLEDAVPSTPVAIFYPLATAFAEGPRHAHAAHFGAWCAALAALSRGHMILDEAALAGARIDDGVLHANGLAFRALVLPAATLIVSAEARAAIDAFAADGGTVWISGQRPTSAGGVEPAAGRVFPEPPDGAALAALLDRLDSDMPAIHASPSILRFAGRDAEGWWRVALFNEADGDESVELAVGGDVEIWNAMDGTIAARQADRLRLALVAQDLACLRIRPASGDFADAAWSEPAEPPAEIMPLPAGWSFRPAEDAAPAPIAVDRGWQAQGHPDLSGTGIYQCGFGLARPACVVLDLPGVSVAVEAEIDGRPRGRRARPPFRLNLGPLGAGSHVLTLKVANTAANRYYAGTPYAGDIWPDESGLTAPPRLLLLPPKA